jgi:hypothetical protein
VYQLKPIFKTEQQEQNNRQVIAKVAVYLRLKKPSKMLECSLKPNADTFEKIVVIRFPVWNNSRIDENWLNIKSYLRSSLFECGLQ